MTIVVAATLVAMALTGMAPAPASAHIQAETPWHGIAYAYLNSVFLLNLEPTDWGLIERVLTTDHEGRILGESAAVRLQAVDGAAATSHWPAVQTALSAKRPDALYSAATKAVSAAIRHHLTAAASLLDQPIMASAAIDEAQAIYRTFAGFVREADPDGFHRLGLAWLELSSSVRQAGVISVAGQPADTGAFETARAEIVDYLERNFEPDAFQPRAVYAPLPEDRVLADPHFQPAAWLPPGSDLNDQDPLPRLVLNIEEQGIDERDVFLVAFGDMLFDSPEIFGEPARSLGLACATCHNRSDVNQRFFIAGISPHPGAVDVDGSFFNARFNDHRDDPIDIPSLRGLRFTGPYGRDGRFASLRDFSRNVIVNEFAGEEPSPFILDALVAYMLEFDFLPARYLGNDGALNDDAPEAAKRGEALFNQPFAQMSGQSCASCHKPGSHFTDNLVHDIGSAGQGAKDGFSGAMDTPTLLGIVHTAPYFHDGRFQTLAQVVDWFDQKFVLELGDQGRADLTAYLEAVGEGSEPYQTFDEATTPFRLMVEELTVFLSTLDTLIPDQDQENADLLLRTVASDMELDASAMSNRDARDKTLELAEALWQLRDAINQDAWDAAAEAWRDYRATADAYDSELR
ncbi:MAG: cytochrome c peroxidase [Geminicoccaceae bacterium]